MDLILWRHAEAELATELIPDIARKLTSKGIKQANKMGWWLDRNLPDNCRILVSPATRTRETVATLALDRKFKILPELSLNASKEDVLRAANWPHSKESVVIVGHQPYLGEIATQLLRSSHGDSVVFDCAIRKGNVWWITQKQREGEAVQTYIKAIMSPDLVVK